MTSASTQDEKEEILENEIHTCGIFRHPLVSRNFPRPNTLHTGKLESEEPCTYCQTNFGYDYYIQPTSPKSTYFKKGRFDDESECA